MPLKLEQYEIGRLQTIVAAIPRDVQSGTIAMHDGDGPFFSFVWDEAVGHVITWKEPRR